MVIVVPSSADLDAAFSSSPPESEPPQPTTSARTVAAARVRSENRRRARRSSDVIAHLLLVMVGRGTAAPHNSPVRDVSAHIGPVKAFVGGPSRTHRAMQATLPALQDSPAGWDPDAHRAIAAV